MAKDWTATEENELARLNAEGKSYQETAQAMGRSKSSVQSKAARLGISFDLSNRPLTEEKWAVERQGLNDTIRQLNTELATIRRDTLDAKAVRRIILGLSEEPPDPPGWILKPGSLGRAGTPVLQLGDLHCGEVVDLAQTNGVNEYDMAIAQKRIRRVVEKVISLCFHHTVGAEYDGIVVNVGGDLLSGDIHDELIVSNEMPIMPVFLDLYGVMVWAIGQLADSFGRVFIPWVPGNHSRNTTKVIYKDRHYSNWDWLLGCLLERHFQDDERVQFYVSPNGTDAYFTVAGHRFLATHGDMLGVRGGDGIIGVVGPMVRGEIKVSGQVRKFGQDFDTMLMFHWHVSAKFPGNRIIANGSLIGWNEYARLKLRAEPEPPSQNLFFVHPDYGITNIWQVYPEQPKVARDVDWTSWPKKAA